MNSANEGGYGVFGRGTERNFRIADEKQREALKAEILAVATHEAFLRDAGFERRDFGPLGEGFPDAYLDGIIRILPVHSVEWWFFVLVRRAEVVGSDRGGAAGYLRLAGEEDFKLRIAIKPQGDYGVFSRSMIIKHELGHFVREARVMAGGRSWIWFLETRSLFEQERRPWFFLYNVFVVLLREEWLVWWFTMPDRRGKFGLVSAMAVLVTANLTASLGFGWAVTIALTLSLVVLCLTLFAWRR